MEGRNHSSAAYITAGSLSRMKEDLLTCSRDLLESFEPRAAIRNRKTKTENLHVGVIGAGLSGLRCAEVLVDRGARVTILEARDRIGGRIHQSKVLNQNMDMYVRTECQEVVITTGDSLTGCARGPNWVHGTGENSLLSIAKATDTKLCIVADTMHVIEPSGAVMPENIATSGLDTVWAFIENAFRYSNEECLNINPSLSLKDFFHEKLGEETLSRDQQARVLLLAEMWGSFIGDSWERQSLRWFWLEECLEGENLYVMGSHASIIQHVAAKPLAKADIHLSTVVSSIESTDTDIHDPKIVVKTDRGGVFTFDEVVVSVPLGCLKREQPAFVPPLPQQIQKAIKNASYSSLEKVYITFPSAFWDNCSASDGTRQTHSRSPEKESQAQTAAGGNLPSFAHFLHPEYVPEGQKHWTIELVPLSSPTVFGSYATPTLLIYTHDPCAAHVSSLIRGLSRDSTEYFDVLDRFFRPYYSHLPNYQPGHADCTPVAILASDWHSDDLAGNGSYTNFQISKDTIEPAITDERLEENGEEKQSEQICLDKDVRAMRAGMPERGIWLAGEHTAPFVALGTTTGAYWSGEAAAVRVLAANRLMGGVVAASTEDSSG